MSFLSRPAGTTAQIVEGALVVNLADAQSPTVWRMDLAKTHAAAVELRPADDAWALGIRGPKSDFTEVARFADKARGDRALAAVSAALLAKPSQPWTLGQVFAVAFFIVVGIWVAWAVTGAVTGTAAITGEPGMAAPAMGVPQDADQALKVPQ